MVDSDQMSRREVADLLGIHPDSVSRNLHDGLASAVIAWGGRGKTMYFSRLRVLRWWRSKTCTANAGRPCRKCLDSLEECAALGEHLIAARHGADETCVEDDGVCGAAAMVRVPCQRG